MKFTRFAKTRLYFIMQYGEGGELFTKITNQGKLLDINLQGVGKRKA